MLALLLLWSILITLGCATTPQEPGAAAPTLQPEAENSLVVIRGEASYSVDLAVTPEERQQGLSGRERMAQDEGMLFVFEEERGLSFWMKEMHFPLDIIWIDAQCRLAGVSANVPTPPPGAGNEEIPRAQSPSPARFVLELNAGEALRHGLQPGNLVEFSGALANKYGC